MSDVSAEAPKDAQLGRVLLSQYQLTEVLGEGGMGTVYRGVQLSVNRPVAIKLISGKIAENPECVRRFRREAEAMAKLRHPNTVRLYEFGVADEGELFMVMELLEGQDLAEHLLRCQRLPPVEALTVARQVLEALGEAHALGIVHRDLKPANIFLSQVHGGRLMAKVMDFGIAGIEQTQASTKLTMAGAVMGTPAYMSPEQAQGKSVDPRSDLYSLGVVLFEMLIGRPPFEADSAVSLLLAHVSTAPPRLIDAAAELSHVAGLQELLDRLLDKDPNRRPTGSSDAIAQIDALLAQLGAPAGASHFAALAAVTAPPYADAAPTPQATLFGAPARFSKGYLALGAGVALLAGFLAWPRPEPAAVEASAPPPLPVQKAEAPPAAVATYSVQILSKPAGASLELSGVEIGKTPYTLQFRRPTKVRLSLAGYRPRMLEVDERSDPLLVVELEPLPVAKLKPTRHSRNADEANDSVEDEPEALTPAEERPQAAPPVQANIAPATPAAVVPAPAVVAPPAAQVHPTPATPRSSTAPIASGGTTKASVAALPPPAWAQPPVTSARDRREAMLKTGPAQPNVAAAKRAYRSGQLSKDRYEDTIWVLKKNRNERLQQEKLNLKQGRITRDEYERRAQRIDAAYEGQ